MNSLIKLALLRILNAAYHWLIRPVVFRLSAQNAHNQAIRLLRALDGLPLAAEMASALHRFTFSDTSTAVGGARLSQRLILAAGLVKGDGFADEEQALRAVSQERNIMPGWRIVPALAGAVELGSFTRFPRLGNPGMVVWRNAATQSTQNRVGLRNPGAHAAARFLGERRRQLPKEYGINIAVSPGVEDIHEQTRHIAESVAFFLDAGVHPTWFTLNLSCPNTEDDPQGHQLGAETRQLCGAVLEGLRARQLHIPLWVKISPGLANEQYRALMRLFDEVGVEAVIATNTLAQPAPDNSAIQAGVGGGELLPAALDAVRQLLAEKQRHGYAVDVIACGGIIDGASLRKYEGLGVKAGQYWSALVYRGPFAAAIIESELAEHDYEFETVKRESLA
ncbi:MAG: hypothetical protein OXG53_10135 [Chloroflexi bacterium]|nr:hypothetical protein [Chloroflexota bacterium]